MSFQLPQLPFAYNALEPVIDEQTMTIHHTKHHQAYVDKLNDALKGSPELQSKSIDELLSSLDTIPENIRTAVRNNGGGHWNHSFFWKLLQAPIENNVPQGATLKKIEAKWQSFDNFKKEFAAAGVGRFGSGWVWLVKDPSGNLSITSTPNQDNPIMDPDSIGAGVPLLGLDVWEHAYYLKYQNKRPDYIDAWWSAINWKQAEENLR